MKPIVKDFIVIKKRIYLINPKNPENFWAMQGALDIVGKNKTLMPNIALLTIIALTPKDVDIEYIVCDENVSPVDWDVQCDLIGITGYTLQFERMSAISAKFRKRGIPVAVGGVYATIDPEKVANIADHLFIGEAEYTWPQFLRDWAANTAKAVYRQDGFIDMKDSPVPDLSYIKAKNYHYFSVQTSRGCPNDCDFCDVVRLVGRQYRSKPVEQILREVKNAHASGAETIFFSDDNFIVNKKFTTDLLRELIQWNRNLDQPVSFSTQATVMIGEDEELLKLLADARFSVIFIGVETLNKECLEEVNKKQMARYNPYEVIPRISSYGIFPFLGLIVGFDHDSPKVFQEIEEFLDKTASPIASISVLNAPKNTTLYERMKKEVRIIEDFRGFWHLSTNIIPKQMSLEELSLGQKNLFKKIYEPEHFERRLIGWLENVKYLSDLYSTRKKNIFRFFIIIKILRHFLFRVPPPVRSMFWNVLKASWKTNPQLISRSMSVLVQYWHYYDFGHKETQQKP
jgi:radical SAM superfamily enzyme YgiQ (UPF0313 family)